MSVSVTYGLTGSKHTAHNQEAVKQSRRLQTVRQTALKYSDMNFSLWSHLKHLEEKISHIIIRRSETRYRPDTTKVQYTSKYWHQHWPQKSRINQTINVCLNSLSCCRNVTRWFNPWFSQFRQISHSSQNPLVLKRPCYLIQRILQRVQQQNKKSEHQTMNQAKLLFVTIEQNKQRSKFAISLSYWRLSTPECHQTCRQIGNFKMPPTNPVEKQPIL